MIVVPADGGFPGGKGLRSAVVHLIVETGSVVGQRQVEVGHIDVGDHTPAGYRQRARFYAVSPEARLLFSKRIAAYLIFLAENTGLASKERCAAASVAVHAPAATPAGSSKTRKCC